MTSMYLPSKNMLSALIVLGAITTTLSSCQTKPEIRAELRAELNRARDLAIEIGDWADPATGRTDVTAAETAESFADRASELCDDLSDVDADELTAIDPKDVVFALEQIRDFPTDRLEDGSEDARLSILRQFGSLGADLLKAADRVLDRT